MRTNTLRYSYLRLLQKSNSNENTSRQIRLHTSKLTLGIFNRLPYKHQLFYHALAETLSAIYISINEINNIRVVNKKYAN